METLKDLFKETLQDVYFAENAILKALPKMAKKATSPDLKEGFTSHLEETKGQVERLKKVFELLGEKPASKKCDAIEGLLKEADGIMEEAKTPQVMDAGLISSAQAVEHYEIARYGTLRTWAKELGMPDAAKLLQATLDEEHACNQTLTELAEGSINVAAERPNGHAAKTAGGAKAVPTSTAKPSPVSAVKPKSATK